MEGRKRRRGSGMERAWSCEVALSCFLTSRFRFGHGCVEVMGRTCVAELGSFTVL